MKTKQWQNPCDPSKAKRKRYKTIIVRGCEIRVESGMASKLESVEREFSTQDWNQNRVD